MNKNTRLYILLAILILVSIFTVREVLSYRSHTDEHAIEQAENEAIERVLNARRTKETSGEAIDPFDKNGQARILLIGLDKRAGQAAGHCDVIQFIMIDRKKQEVTITAVPRGTYSPLPPGKGTTSSDYYVSNSCGLGGLEYGITQIEKIVGQKEDHLVIVGFSETLGILRSLKLPTTETLQWLRHRQGYAIGEPQRARNHSTFIKDLMVKYVPEQTGKIDEAFQYILYKMVKTDLSFAESRAFVDALSQMDLKNHPERIHLTMKPAYDVQDIPYVPENLKEYLAKMIDPIKNRLNPKDYSGSSVEEIQKNLLDLIDQKKDDQEFNVWAFDNNLWLQVEDNQKRLEIQYDIIQKYVTHLADKAKQKEIISDYIIEMQHYGEDAWSEKGKELLENNLK